MSYEKPHDSFHWKHKLDELDHLPSEPLADKTAAWERLQERMHQKPRKRIAISYWMVAACLFLAIGVSWFMMDQNDPGFSEEGEQQTGKKPVTVSIEVINKNDSVANNTKVMNNRKSLIIAEVKNKKPGHTLMETASKGEEVKLNQDTVIESLPEITNNTTNYIDTTAAIAVLPVKKKMRVVHINELNQCEEENQLARKNAAPAFQTRPFTQDDGLISISRNASDNLIKIKLSPSN
jgi:hypothetical protein